MNEQTPAPAEKRPASPARRRIVKWTLILAACVALYALAGFVILPKVAQSMLPERLAEATGRKAEVRAVRFNPFSLVLEVEGLRVLDADGEGEFVSLELLRADADFWALFRLAAGLEELRLVEPSVRVGMDAGGRWSFADILEKLNAGGGEEAEKADEAGAAASLPALLGSNLVVERGRVEFTDGTTGVTHVLEDLNLSVPSLSTLPGDKRDWVRPSLSARINGHPLVLEGRTRPFEDSLRTEFVFSLDGLDLTRYRPYAPLPDRVALAGGALSCDLSLIFSQGADAAPTVSVMGPVRVAGLDVRLDGKPLAGFDELSVRVDGLNLAQKVLSLGEVRLSAPRVAVTLDKQGRPTFAALLPASGPDSGPSSDADKAEAKQEADDAGGKAFAVLVSRFELADGELRFRDEARDFALRAAPLAATVDGLNTAGGDAPFTLSVGLDGKPLLSAKGALDPAAQSAQGELRLDGLDLTTFAPYYAEALPMQLAGCTAGAGLRFAARAGNPPTLTVDGLDVELKNMALRAKDGRAAGARVKSVRLSGGSLDAVARSGKVESLAVSGVALHPATSEKATFAALESLTLTGAAFGAAQDEPPTAALKALALKNLSVRPPGGADPALSLAGFGLGSVAFDGQGPALDVGSVSIRSPHLLAALDASGTPDIQRILSAATGEPLPQPKSKEEQEQEKKAEEAKESEKKPAPAQDEAAAPRPPALLVTVDSLDLRDGALAFRDAGVSPAYSTALKDLSGSLKNFSNAPGAPPSTLRLAGMVDGQAPLSLEVEASPTDLGLNPKARLAFTDVDLTGFSPYTSKFVSYTLARGQLSFDLDARVEGRALNAESLISLRGIELGRYAESPDDLGLPLPLALALLTDRSGNVELDIPVQGSLDDPNFRLGKVIMKAVLNLLFKAVTSPFALIGGLFGGGEDLNALAMAPGSSALTPALEQKIDTMAKALADRPRLRVEVAGTASPGSDPPALTALRLKRAVNAVRFLELEKDGQAPASVDDVALTPAEYPDYLRRAYKAAPFEKPDEVDGLEGEEAVAAMERLLAESLAATDADAAELARARALAVKDALLARGVEPGRVFLREATDADAKQVAMGAVLSLK